MKRLCPICSGDKGEVLYTQSFVMPYSLPPEYDVVCCSKCGFVYMDMEATQEDYNKFYRQFSRYEHKGAPSTGEKSWDKSRLRKTAQDIDYILKDKKSSILDIGCGNGGLLSALRERGYNNLTGLDPSSGCVSNVRDRGIKAYVGGLFKEQGRVLKRKYDCVILRHVLEHVYDLRKATENTMKLLKPDGILYVEVPDASRYADFYIKPYHYFDYEHINHFDMYSLRNLFNKMIPMVYSIKDIPQSDKLDYPAFYIVFRFSPSVHHREIVPSFDARNNIVEYIKMSKNGKSPEIKFKEPIVIWGVGAYTLNLLKGKLGKCDITAFVDNDTVKQKLKIRGIPVYPPSYLKTFSGPVVVSTVLFNDEIRREIKKMGL